MSDQPASDRDRRLFRIQDRVYFSVSRVPDAPADQPLPTPVGDDLLQDLPDKLSALAHESRSVFLKLFKDVPEAAAAIKLLDKKINLLAAALLAQSFRDAGQVLVDVSLSASGVGFFSSEPLPNNAPVEVTLFLPPNLYKIVVRGNAVYCRVKEDGPSAGQYWIGVDFSELGERDQTLLSGHVLKKQAEDIKLQRGERNEGLEANRLA